MYYEASVRLNAAPTCTSPLDSNEWIWDKDCGIIRHIRTAKPELSLSTHSGQDVQVQNGDRSV